jgi:membrane protein required for colicin V production
MTWLDYAVLGVMGLSVVWGAWRGLVREMMSLAGWVIAFLAANLFAAPLAATLPRSISPPELRVLVAFVGVFVLSLALTSLAGLALAKMLRSVGLGGLDRTLGGLFGVARGAVIVLAFALLAGLTRLPLDPMWQGSVSGPLLGRAALALKPWLPPAFGDRLRYH